MKPAKTQHSQLFERKIQIKNQNNNLKNNKIINLMHFYMVTEACPL